VGVVLAVEWVVVATMAMEVAVLRVVA